MALLTLAEYKVFENINSDTYDTKLQAIIDSVDIFIKGYCGRQLERAQYTERPELLDYTAFLSEFPVVSIDTIEYLDYDDNTVPLTSSNYRLFPEEGIIELYGDEYVTMMNERKFKERYVDVTYTAGWDTNEIPEDIKLAMSELVKYYHKDESSPVKSQNVRTIDYSVMSSIQLPPHIKRILSLYRRIE